MVFDLAFRFFSENNVDFDSIHLVFNISQKVFNTIILEVKTSQKDFDTNL